MESFRKNFIVLLLMLISCTLTGHELTNYGAKIYITTSTHLVISGSFTNKKENGHDGEIINNGTIQVDGNWTNTTSSGEVFSGSGTGTVILNGTDQRLSGKTRFFNLTKNVTASATLTFQDGPDGKTTITNILDLQGVAGQLLLLRSDSDNTRWYIDPQGSRDLLYLDVKDSKNIDVSRIDVIGKNCIDSGNNIKWKFKGDPLIYTVNFTPGTGGSITGETTQKVSSGQDCSAVVAVPDTGYEFSGWTGDFTGTENPITITNVTKNMTITANFSKPDTYTVAFETSGNGSLSGETIQTVIPGGDCSAITAIPEEENRFVGWTGDYVGIDNPLTITDVSKNMTIYAVFAPIGSHIVTFQATTGGSISGETPQYVTDGGNCSAVTATPKSGYKFIGWTGDYTGTDNPLTVTNVTKGMTFTANFNLDIVQLEMAITGQGTPEPSVGTYQVNSNTEIEITATPADYYRFNNWTSSENAIISHPASAETTVILTGNAVITANFVKMNTDSTILLSTNKTPINSGTVTLENTPLKIFVGTTVSLNAIPDEGFTFSRWLGENANFSDPNSAMTTVTPCSDCVATAYFVNENMKVLVSVMPEPFEGGIVTPFGITEINQGSVITLQANPLDGYKFIEWQSEGNTEIQNKFTSETVAVIKGNTTIKGIFAAEENTGNLTISVDSEGGGRVGNEGQSTAQAGQTRPLFAQAYAGYIFLKWDVTENAIIDNEYQPETFVTVHSGDDVEIVARFAERVKSINPKYPKLKIHLSSKHNNNDTINIKKMPVGYITFDPSSQVTVRVDGNRFEINDIFGKFQRTNFGYKYISKDKHVRFSLNLDKGHWKFKAGKQSLNFDNSNGIDILLKIDDDYYGANYMADEQTKYHFKQRKNDNIQNLLKDYFGNFQSFDVKKMRIETSNEKVRKNKIDISDAEVKFPIEENFDPETDAMTIYVDKAAIIIHAGSFLLQGKNKYVYKDEENGIYVCLDLLKNTWSFKLTDNDIWDDIYFNDGISIYMMIGINESGRKFLDGSRVTRLKYNK